MNLSLYVEDIHRQLMTAAEAGGDDARTLAERLVAPLGSAIRLALQDVLASAAEEITCELAPGSVELRLRGREPEFVVSLPPADAVAGEPAGGRDDGEGDGSPEQVISTPGAAGSDEGGMARINLRLPEHLKARVERAADGEGLSVNAWLVRAASAAIQRADPDRRHQYRAPVGGRSFTGWAR